MAVTLDELDAWGTLDSAGLASVAATLDGADSLSFQEVTASVSVSASVNSPDFTKAKSFVATPAATSATATADVGHIKTVVSASTSAAGSVSASAILIRLVQGLPTANVSATATITGIRQVETVDAVNYTVTVVQSGGHHVFALNGVERPAITVNDGFFYVFDVSDASNSGHPLVFQSSGVDYFAGVERTGTAGTSGATVKIFISAGGTIVDAYACSVHGAGMGNTITSSATSNPLPTFTSAQTNLPEFLYVTNVDGSAACSATASMGGVNGIFAFSGAAGVDTAATVIASGEILGEKWTVVPDTTGIWAVQ